jgi:putative effector of murein hydrolase
MGVKDPIARGLGMGAAAQGLGVSALVSEPDAFPFAAISMVLTAICSTSLVSIPAVKNQLVSIATGA